MKTNLLTLFLLLIVANTASAQSAADKWPALAALHGVVSQTFHPAEEGNLEPVKTRSQELYEKSAALLKSDIPAEFRTKSILAAAEKLQTKAKLLNRMVVAKAADADILKALSELHDIFHEIAEQCADGKK